MYLNFALLLYCQRHLWLQPEIIKIVSAITLITTTFLEILQKLTRFPKINKH